MNKALERLKAIDHEIRTLQTTGAVLGWDQQVLMPERAVSHRAEQLALLTKLIHDRETASEIGRLLETLGASEEQPMGSPGLEPDDRVITGPFKALENLKHDQSVRDEKDVPPEDAEDEKPDGERDADAKD